jgi:hypothetical protein
LTISVVKILLASNFLGFLAKELRKFHVSLAADANGQDNYYLRLFLYDVRTQEGNLFCASFDVRNDINTRPEGVKHNFLGSSHLSLRNIIFFMAVSFLAAKKMSSRQGNSSFL